jgi:hypothetical protein
MPVIRVISIRVAIVDRLAGGSSELTVFLPGINSPVDETIRIPQVLKDNKLYSAVLWSMGGEKYKLVLTKTTN